MAVFTDIEMANSFTERHPRFFGRYRVEEKEVNPYFEKTDRWVYQVIIDPEENSTRAIQIDAFDEEQLIYKNPVSKHDDVFYMFLFAVDKKEALVLAKARFEEMVASGEWLLMPDEADEEDDED